MFAHRFIKKHNLWKWILVPGLVYAVLFFACIYFFGKTCNDFLEWLNLETGLKNWIDQVNDPLIGFLLTLGSLILWLLLLLFYFSLFKYVFLAFGAPIFTYLSEKIESIIEGKPHKFEVLLVYKGFVRALGIAVRNVLWQSVYSLTILLVGLVPIIGWPAPILSIFIECFYLGFSMLDHSLEHNDKSTSESMLFINNHQGLAIGNGIVFYAMHLMPFIGWVLAPAYSVVAASLSMKQAKAGGVYVPDNLIMYKINFPDQNN